MLYGACVPAEDSRSVHGHGPWFRLCVPAALTMHCVYMCV